MTVTSPFSFYSGGGRAIRPSHTSQRSAAPAVAAKMVAGAMTATGVTAAAAAGAGGALEIDGGGGGDGAKVGLPVQGLGREWSGESGGVDGGALGSGDGCGGGSGLVMGQL